MKFDRTGFSKEANATGFPADSLEKVLRLRELLGEFQKHSFLRGKLVLKGGTALNLFYLQRVLRHAKSHVTKDRYIKTFDPALVAAMKKLEATVDLVNQSAPRVHQIN